MCSISKVEKEVYEIKEENESRINGGHTYMQWLFGLLASTTLLTCGILSGWISPMTKHLQSDQSPIGETLTDEEMSWIGTTFALMATFGVVLYAYIADVYGRKIGLIAILIPQAISWAIKISATNSTMLIISRVFGGIPAGGCFNLVPMYVKEISQDSIRGAMVSMTILMNNFGLLAIYVMGSYMDYYLVLYIGISIPIFTGVLMIFTPESPAYLVKMEKYEEAAKATALLRSLDVDHKVVQAEVQLMISEEKMFSSLPKITALNIFKNKACRKGFILMIMMLGCQACNGIFAIMTYGWSILNESGVNISPELSSIIIPIVSIIGSLIAMVCVEKVGRKILLGFTFALAAISLFTLATSQLLRSQGHDTPDWLLVAAIAMAVWSNAAGITPMVYVIMSEIFSFQVRAKLIGCLVTYGWLMSSVQLYMFAPISNSLGIHAFFFIFGGINICGAVMTLLLPETKAKTIEEIERLLEGK